MLQACGKHGIHVSAGSSLTQGRAPQSPTPRAHSFCKLVWRWRRIAGTFLRKIYSHPGAGAPVADAQGPQLGRRRRRRHRIDARGAARRHPRLPAGAVHGAPPPVTRRDDRTLPAYRRDEDSMVFMRVVSYTVAGRSATLIAAHRLQRWSALRAVTSSKVGGRSAVSISDLTAEPRPWLPSGAVHSALPPVARQSDRALQAGLDVSSNSYSTSHC